MYESERGAELFLRKLKKDLQKDISVVFYKSMF